MTHPRLSPDEAARLITEDGFVYLDVRTEEEFELGHPQGAYNVPSELRDDRGAMAENADFLRVVQAHWGHDAKLVVGCRSGNRSRRACAQLMAAGFSRVVEQRAGTAGVKDAFGATVDKGWERCGLAMAMQAEAGRSYRELRARVTAS